MSFNQRLKELRTENKLSQAEFSKDIFEKFGVECHPICVSHYERGTRKPSYPFLVAVALYFDVSADYLLGRTDSKKDSSVKYNSNINVGEFNSINIGYNLRKIREISKLRQDDISEQLLDKFEITCSAMAISNYERNARKPDFFTLGAIADILNVSVDYLLGLAELNIKTFTSKWNIEDKKMFQEMFLVEVKAFFEDDNIEKNLKDKLFNEISAMYLDTL